MAFQQSAGPTTCFMSCFVCTSTSVAVLARRFASCWRSPLLWPLCSSLFTWPLRLAQLHGVIGSSLLRLLWQPPGIRTRHRCGALADHGAKGRSRRPRAPLHFWMAPSISVALGTAGSGISMRPVPNEMFASEASGDAARCRAVSDDLLRRDSPDACDGPVSPGAYVYRRGGSRPDPGSPSLTATTPCSFTDRPCLMSGHDVHVSCQTENGHVHACL